MKKTIRNIIRISGWLLLVSFLVVTLAFSSREMAGTSCTGIAIRYAGHSPIRLEASSLARMARTADPHLIGKNMDEIDTEAIEAEMAKNKALLRADAFKTIVRDSTGWKGILTLKVKHRVPVLRIISSHGNYFMDAEGHRIPPSSQYAADVPVATGLITEESAREDLLPLVTFISKNKFWKAQIRQIHVDGSGDILFSTLVGNQLIEFGSPENMEEKFRNLRTFYEQVLTEGYWNKYKRISVKYKNQVIAKKNR